MQDLKDTQNELDTRQISIDRVGVRGVRFPIVVSDKEQRTQSTVATVALMVDLPEKYKGTHMSRFVEALHEHKRYLDVRTAVRLPNRLLTKLHAQRARVEVEFPFFRLKKAPVSGMEGMMDYEVRFEIDAEVGKPGQFTLTLKVPVTTLCPCSKAMSEHGAHNQRGIVTYSVRFSGKAVWIEDLIDLIEGCKKVIRLANTRLLQQACNTNNRYFFTINILGIIMKGGTLRNCHPDGISLLSLG